MLTPDSFELFGFFVLLDSNSCLYEHPSQDSYSYNSSVLPYLLRETTIAWGLDGKVKDTNDVLKAMEADSKIKLSTLKVDGGASANNFLMQFQSYILNTKVRRPRCVETTAMGAAYLVGLAVGYWKDKEDVIKNWNVDREFEPAIEEAERNDKIAGWKKAVKCSFGWAKES